MRREDCMNRSLDIPPLCSTLPSSLEELLHFDGGEGQCYTTYQRATISLFRVHLVREAEYPYAGHRCIKHPSYTAPILTDFLNGVDREHFVALFLDKKKRIIGIHTVSVGVLDHTLVHPREVFKLAILTNAASIIVCHNHPSGDPTPSAEDRAVTLRLAEAGRILGIELLDHIVVGECGRYTSLKSSGLM
jgi:DNA repair protein RadC